MNRGLELIHTVSTRLRLKSVVTWLHMGTHGYTEQSQ